MLTLTQWPGILALIIGCVLNKVVDSKVYERCELAKILRQRHGLDVQEVAQLVCIAQHSSGFNTASQAYSSAGGSHGLFQISDVYWCSQLGRVSGCNIPCHKLRDDNLTDDLSCVKQIYDEHQRISGDGYTAWNAYQQYCRNNAASYIRGCFPAEIKESTHLIASKGYSSYDAQYSGNSIEEHVAKKQGKIYGKCELARELYHKYQMPMEQVPTWVCIAEHESRFNTAAVGRLNTDGSADHGLFQISDLYWCSQDRYSGGKACGLSCSKLLDDDITDDVRCVKRIHNEHAAISGDGFNAWTVYQPFCQNQYYNKVASCFSNTLQSSAKGYSNAVGFSNHQAAQQYQSNPFFRQQSPSSSYYTPNKPNDIFKSSASSYSSSSSISSHKGKVFTRCSLAQELYFIYKFPMQDISTWVCIAEQGSQFNTAAIGRLNTDGSSNHGLFQISDRYWCTHNNYGGKACNIPCDKLLDEDLRDDVRCLKIIYEEHTRISGDGFNAWTAYQPHCTKQNIEHIKQCFDGKDLATNEVQHHNPNHDVEPSKEKGKIYKKCELAQELYHQHQMPMDQIPKWVCIAQHESSFNTAAVGRLNTDGSADHGLFQISDLYWCTHDQYGGKACNIPCDKLLDSDISDDVKCIKIIHEEHTRISGDGFTAWTVYKPYCQNPGMDHIKACFTEEEFKETHKTLTPINNNPLQPHYPQTSPKETGKIYKKCELAQELYQQHQMPMDQIPKWVCIAQHESSFNTAAIGRLNTDGSADHGLFQISDLYWCTHDQYGGKACNIPCDKLLDSDISDDVKCIKIIYEEHTRISGDGFNAWTVYKPYCQNIGMDHIKACFTEEEFKETHKILTPINNNSLQPQYPQTSKNGKIYKKCELAQELLSRHKMPMEQIPTWVCIAQYESSFNTSAVGRFNADGSADHGLFQISDLYWCSHDQYGGKACNIPCDKLLDSDISDDVKCIKIIYEEHNRISGNGFNAWTVYKTHCRSRKMEDIRSCFTGNEIIDYENNLIFPAKPVVESKPVITGQQQDGYSHNPFLSGLSSKPSSTQKPVVNKPDFKIFLDNEKQNYANNPFLKNSITQNQTHKFATQSQNQITNYNNNPFLQPTKLDAAHISINHHNYKNNPFLNNKLKPLASTQNVGQTTKPQILNDNKPLTIDQAEEITSKPNYNKNPFLNGSYKPGSQNKVQQKYSEAIRVNSFSSNPFLNGNIKISATEKPTNGSLSYQYNPFLQNLPTPSPTKNYLNSNQFRTTITTRKPTISATTTTVITKTTTTRKPNISTTLKPITTFTNQKPTISLTTTTKPITTTTRKTTTTLKTTTKKPATTSWTTKFPKTTTTWNWQNQKYANSTIKPYTTQLTNTKSPKTTTTWSWQNQKYVKPTTTPFAIQSSTTKSPKTTTTWSWQNQKYTNPTTKPTTIRTFTTKIPRTTTTRTTSTWSWQNQQYAKTTTKPTTTNWITTTKFPKTTKTATTWNWQNQRYSNATTTKSPQITTKRVATTRNWLSQKYTNKPTDLAKTTPNWNSLTAKLQTTTTLRPEKTTWNWQHHQQTKTTKIPTTALSLITTSKKPITTTKNWQVYDKTTTTKSAGKIISTHIPVTTKKSITTTKPTLKTTWNWLSSTLKPTTTKSLTTTKKTTTTTKSPTTKTVIQQSLKTNKPTTPFTTKPQTTRSINQESHKTTTLKPAATKTTKHSTAAKPSTTKSTTIKSYVTTTLKPFNTTKSSAIKDYEKFKKDPFSHPFFAKVNEEIRRLKGNTTTTKLPPFTATKLLSFPDYPYYQDYQNSKGNNTRTIVDYNFSGTSNQTTTTKRPRL